MRPRYELEGSVSLIVGLVHLMRPRYELEGSVSLIVGLVHTPTLDAMRWWLFHESLAGVIEDRVILWVRTDLTYSQ